MSEMIRLLIVDDDIGYREEMRRAFENHPSIKVTGLAQGGKDALNLARDTAPDAALVDLGLVDMSGLEVAEGIAKASPGTVVFLVTDAPSMELYRRATAIGVRQVFTKSMSAMDIGGQIEQEVEQVRLEMRKKAEEFPMVPPGSGPFKKNVLHTPKQIQTVKKVTIGVLSPKGGVGKTTTAVNMAAAAAAQASLKTRVCLIDLNEFGCVTMQLNLGSPERGLDGDPVMARNILNWQYVNSNPSREEIEEFLVYHPDGIWVIPTVPAPEKIVEVSQQLISKVLDILKHHFDLIIIDLPPSITLDVSWATAELVDYLFVVVTPDVQVIPGMSQLNKILAMLNCDSKCYRLVNKYDEEEALDMSELDRVVPYPNLGRFPEDPGVRKACKLGKPYVLVKPDSEYAVSVRAALNQVFPVFAGGSASKNSKTLTKGLFGGLFGRVRNAQR